MGLDTFFTPRMTELGKIKIGGKGEERQKKRGGTYRLPVKLDHFIITTLQRSAAGDLVEDADLMKQLAVEYGDTDGLLRQIPIQVLSNDIEDIMQTRYVWYAGRRVGAKSDGKEVTWYYKPSTLDPLPVPKVEPFSPKILEHAKNGVKLFKTHTVFNCVIASEEARFGGVYKFRTTSVISGRQLYSSLLEVSTRTFGVLMGLPLRMVVRPMQVTPEGKATTIYIVHVELHAKSLQAVQRQALDQMKVFADHRDQLIVVQQRYKGLLTAPGDEGDTQEITDISEEFCPEPISTTESIKKILNVPKQQEPEQEPEVPEITHEFDRDAAENEINEAIASGLVSHEQMETICEGLAVEFEKWNQCNDARLESILSKICDLKAAKE